MLDVNKELAARNFLGEWSEVVVRDRNHPSLVTWTPFNETWGGGPDAYVRLIRDVYNITKAIDPTRPVNDASGDNHVITDIWSVHNYEQDRVKLTEQLKMEEGKEPYRNARDKDFLAVYEGQPYMVDEFGGIPWDGRERPEKFMGIRRHAGKCRSILQTSGRSDRCLYRLTARDGILLYTADRRGTGEERYLLLRPYSQTGYETDQSYLRENKVKKGASRPGMYQNSPQRIQGNTE